MKKIIISLCLLLCFSFTMNNSSSAALAATQSTEIKAKDAFKGMFSIVTYNELDNILHSGYGFFIDDAGNGIAAFSLFQDAYRADIIDYNGKKYPVHRILGASSNYDLVKFSTFGTKKTTALPIAQIHDTEVGTQVGLVQYSGKKKSMPISTEIHAREAFEDYLYFTISAKNTEKNIGCPLLNESGEVIGITQKNVDPHAKQAYAIDARFVNSITISATSLLNADLKEIHMTKGLPNTEKEALTYIYMLGYKDSVAYANAINDFIETYAENAEGYMNRGNFRAFNQQYELAEADFNQALELADKKTSTIKADEIHNNFSQAIYNKVINHPYSTYDQWDLTRALKEAEEAYTITPSRYYLLQQAHCSYALKDYQKAYNLYVKVNTDNFLLDQGWSAQAESETWLYAARAYEHSMQDKTSSRDDSLQVIALMDSAITILPQPYLPSVAPYFLEHAKRCEALKLYRKAVFDYNEYEKIIGPKNLNDKFYYLREQAELKSHMYQQALDDIQTAISFNPSDPFYPIEKALIQLQVGMYKEAIATSQKSLETLPENPDCYKIMGIAYGELKNKKQALIFLKKAKELGDPTVDIFIQKYQ